MFTAGQIVTAAELEVLADGSVEKPLVRLVAQSTQSLADNTATAITFGASSEDIDTNGFHNTGSNTSRVTPTVAGYYRVTGTGVFGAQTTPVVSSAWIRKNGATNLPAAGRTAPGTQAFSLTATVIVSLDGATDYVELMMQQDSSGAVNTNVSSQFTTVLEVEFLRGL